MRCSCVVWAFGLCSQQQCMFRRVGSNVCCVAHAAHLRQLWAEHQHQLPGSTELLLLGQPTSSTVQVQPHRIAQQAVPVFLLTLCVTSPSLTVAVCHIAVSVTDSMSHRCCCCCCCVPSLFVFLCCTTGIPWGLFQRAGMAVCA